MDESKRFIIFKLCGQLYAIPIDQVKEILVIEKICKLPNMPEHILGVTNLRGKAHMIIDMRVLFDLERKTFEGNSKVIIINGNNLGLIVDEVDRIIQVEDTDMEAAGDLDMLKNNKYIAGVIKTDNNTIVSLDVGSFTNSEAAPA